MAYDAAGNETLVVTGYGTPVAESTYYGYDANGNQTEVITGYNSSQQDTILSKYDGDGNLTQQTDPDGEVSDFLYDALGDQTLAELGVGTPQQSNSEDYYDGDGNLTLSIDGDGNSSSYLYDADGNETLAIQGYGSSAASSSSYAYDAAGEQTLAVTGYGTPAAESTFYAYDANGNQTLTITGYNSSKPETTVSLYDGDGNLTQQIDPDGDTSDFAYDSLGDQTLSVLGAGTPQAASSHDYYDGDDNLTLSVDADGDSTSYLYDADGNNTLMIEGVGTSSASTTSMAYDSDGDNTLMIEGVGTSAASTTSMAYDAAGNQTLAITGYNSSKPETTIARYDGDGNLTQEVDADGDTSDFAYDAVGDQTLSVAGAGSSDPGSTSDFYDGDGNLTLTVNPVGDSTSYQYDADGNETLEIDGFDSSSAATIHYLYDASGNQTQEVDPDGNTTSWEYDADGDQTLMIQAYGTSAAATTSYQYDNDGNQTLQINPNGTSIASGYDADGNLINETWYNTDGSVANSSNYTYDGDGNILTAGNDAGSYSFGYNADGEQTLVVNPNGVTLNYQYDADGNATKIWDSLGDTVTSQYDADGDLLSRGYSGPNGAQLLVELGYDDDGNLTSINRYSDLAGTQLVGTSSYAYDAQGNVTSIVHDNASGTTLDSFSYSYDAADDVTQQVENGTTTAYSYDANQQLTSAGTAAYSYDANGNPDATGDSVGPNNELLSDGTWNYSYDANGNMIGKTGVAGGPDAGLTWAYAYDPGNELISATETNSQGQTLVQETFTYDVFGDILATSLSTDGGSPVDTNYVYNGSTLWATTNASNVPEDFYLSGDQPDQYFAQYDATNGPAWYLTNNLDSVCTTMDNSGAAIDNIVYDAYGNVISQSNSTQQPLPGFTGLLTFAAVGVDAADLRIYDPQSGQWMQQDPIFVSAGPNTREYVDDEPTNATDPTGEYLFADQSGTAKFLVNYFHSKGATSVIRDPDMGGYTSVFLYSNHKQIEDLIATTKSQSLKDMLSAMISDTNNVLISAQQNEANKPTGVTFDGLQFFSQATTVSQRERAYLNQVKIDATEEFRTRPTNSLGRFADNVYPGQYRVDDQQKIASLPPRFDAEQARRNINAAYPDRTQDERDEMLAVQESMHRNPELWAAPNAAGGGPPNQSQFEKLLASNEFQQGLNLVGAGFEALSGVVMIVNPFVPVASQAVGVMLIGHALDKAYSSGQSLAEGKNIETYTQIVSASEAKLYGASDETANKIGVVADNLPGMLALTHDGAQGLTALVKYGLAKSSNLGKASPSLLKKLDVPAKALAKSGNAQVRVLTLTEKGAKALGNTGCFVAGTPTWIKSPRSVPVLIGNKNSPTCEAATPDSLETTIPIEEVVLGQRVSARNPANPEHLAIRLQLDYSGWKIVRLEVRHANGSIVDVELLRSAEWIARNGLQVGVTIDLQLTEIEVAASAHVLSIEAGPEIAAGEGAVVTGRFMTREGSGLVRVTFAGGTRLVGTANHPVWSPEGWTWRGLGEFDPGRLVQTRSGLAMVASSEKLAARLPLYNIEVDGEHVYEVTALGVLVHNNNPLCERLLTLRLAASKGGLTAEESAELAALEAAAKANPAAFAPKQGELFPTRISSGRLTKIAPQGTEPLPLPGKLENPGEYLKTLGKDALGRGYPGSTIGGGPTHAHHIVMQEGVGEAGKKAVEESQAILLKYGIDPYRSVENLVWAPNTGYLRSDAYAEKVLEMLKAAPQNKQGITEALKKIGERVSRGLHLE